MFLVMDKFRFMEFLLELQVEGVADMLEKHIRFALLYLYYTFLFV